VSVEVRLTEDSGKRSGYKYRSADKSLARQGRKQAKFSVRMA